MASAPPFFVMCMCFFINGINFSLINIQANAVLALLPSKTLLGLGHSLFGAGALVAPLISTQFAQISRWSFHYLVLLGWAIGDFVQMVGVFRGRGVDDILKEMGIAPEVPKDPPAATGTEESGMEKEEAAAEVAESSEQAVGILPKKLYAPLLALFTFLCVGIEVSIGGTFLPSNL
jgi:fucose permease